MKKETYQAPVMEAFDVVLDSSILTASAEGLGKYNPGFTEDQMWD